MATKILHTIIQMANGPTEYLTQRVRCICGHMQDAVAQTPNELRDRVRFYRTVECDTCESQMLHADDDDYDD